MTYEENNSCMLKMDGYRPARACRMLALAFMENPYRGSVASSGLNYIVQTRTEPYTSPSSPKEVLTSVHAPRPTAEEGNATATAASGGNDQQQLGGKPVATASGAATVVSNASTMVSTTGATLLSGLEKSGVTISAEASRALQTHALQIAHSQIVTTSQSPATVTVATSQPQQQQQQQQQQHSNIILVRGSRSENGQIILQNTHELLSLLSDEDKPIFLQHQRLTTSAGTTIAKAHTTKTLAEATTGTSGGASTILFQPAIKSGTLESISGVGGTGGTILLQSDALKKGTTLEVGSTSAAGTTGGPIFLQQRLSKNGTEGPILLRTLKRLDKSQSILVIRNATAAGTVATAGSTVVAASAAAAAPGGISVTTAGGATLAKVKPVSTPTTTVVTVTAAPVGAGGGSGSAIARRVQDEVEEKKEPVVVAKVVHKSNNMPLGTGLPDRMTMLVDSPVGLRGRRIQFAAGIVRPGFRLPINN
uniref:Uncharacterized protein n=1 Tax=Anopheles farauti TaxID=69004 RepID=A0A182QGC7_9DIPT